MVPFALTVTLAWKPSKYGSSFHVLFKMSTNHLNRLMPPPTLTSLPPSHLSPTLSHPYLSAPPPILSIPTIFPEVTIQSHTVLSQILPLPNILPPARHPWIQICLAIVALTLPHVHFCVTSAWSHGVV
jgi:hypothetical protein